MTHEELEQLVLWLTAQVGLQQVRPTSPRRRAILRAEPSLAGERGERGERGEAGPKGEAGPQGATGSRGEPGPMGPPGDSGATGPKGDKGDKGEPGLAGAAGSAGPKGDKGEPGPLWPDVFIVSPGATLPFFASVQAAIDAAVVSGERTDADPAMVLILPGDYSEDVVLRKHVALVGFDRLGHFTTIIRGQVTCSLTLEGGVREKTVTTIAGLSIFPPSGKTAGIYFSGSSSQKLILTDVAIEGSVPALLADNTFTSGTGTSQILLADCRLRSTSPLTPALRVKSGAMEASRSNIWNRPTPGAATSPTAIHLGPTVAQPQPCTVALTDCNLEGNVQIDSSLSTATAAGSVGLSLLRCTQFIVNSTAVPIRFVLVTPSAAAGVTGLAVVLSIFRATAWTAGTAMIFGNPGGGIPVINHQNSFRADTGVTVAALTGGTATNTTMGAV